MRHLLPGTPAPLNGTYIEIGHGGKRLKTRVAKKIEAKQGEELPALAPQTISLTHGTETKKATRQNKWLYLHN